MPFLAKDLINQYMGNRCCTINIINEASDDPEGSDDNTQPINPLNANVLSVSYNDIGSGETVFIASDNHDYTKLVQVWKQLQLDNIAASIDFNNYESKSDFLLNSGDINIKTNLKITNLDTTVIGELTCKTATFDVTGLQYIKINWGV